MVDLSFDDAEIEYDFIGELSEDEQSEIIQIYEDEFDDGLEDLGWRPKDTECWFYGELEITNAEAA